MPRRIWHDASGNFGIIDSDYPGALSAPASYFSRVYLHADLDYMRVVYDQTQSVTLSARSQSVDGWKGEGTYSPFSSHGLGVLPYAVLIVSGIQYPALSLIQINNTGDSWRTLALASDTSSFWLRETWQLNTSVPSTTISARVIAYQVATGNTHTKDWHYEPSGRIRAAKGKFDTNLDYLRVVDSGVTPDFYMAGGRTIDASGAGFRQSFPNGGTIDVNYGGSFVADFYGVQD